MTEFLFFRHGETDWNLQRIFQGHTDIPLNSRGQSQAESLAKKIQHWKPDIVLSSDLSRAVQTAQACQKFWNAPLIQSPLLREMNLGKAEGLHRNEVQGLVGDSWKKWVSHDPQDEDFRFPEGESKSEARIRILNFLQTFSRDNPQYKRVVVSTHGGVLRRVTHGLPGTPAEGVPIPNCISYRLNLNESIWSFVAVRERASVVVTYDEKILTFYAIDPHSKRPYHFLPGGLIEVGETISQCVERECQEETGYPIRSLEESLETREYDFLWNNQLYWSRSHFLKGELVNPYEAPLAVQDADYNKGVVWVPSNSLEAHFDYSAAIKEIVNRQVS